VNESVLGFYDRMASEYHLMFGDWRSEVRAQGATLDRLLRVDEQPLRVLDCACGIGTQAIGLALQGHRVHATDLSPAAVARARSEAEAFGATLTFGVAAFQSLSREVPAHFDVVVCCDNAIAHVIDDSDLVHALNEMRSRLVPGGRLVVSIRDYDRLLEPQGSPVDPGLPGMGSAAASALPGGTMPRVFDGEGGRRIAFQVWDWTEDRRSYAVNQFFVKSGAEGYTTSHYVSRFRALRRAELTSALRQAGFLRTEWRMPAESGFYQPLVIASRD